MSDESMQSAVASEASSSQIPQEEVLARIGHLTRNLHDSLRELGFDKLLETAANDIPDARDRLMYVARMTEQAADRVLNATDIANPLQDKIAEGAMDLHQQWQEVLAVPSLKSEYDRVANQTLLYLDQSIQNTDLTKQQLMDIMMAQDFQDLTGQVIKKVTEIAQDIEKQLVQVLVDFSPATTKKEDKNSGLMNGPQIAPEKTVDVVASQEQVDDLLDSLGF
ncbi:protein phosphatase CheZ [Methylovorus sp. MM2]|uniref:protein phosphatase CheZ n=1 Tax=Methylovorus sp. MM2 TaxID=1848038 RepID=UPI0007E0D315|nr:protein phosphatase CheZ [Methylovorus sp. MM2]